MLRFRSRDIVCKPFFIRALPVFCALIGLFFLAFPSMSPAQAIGPVQSVSQDSTPTANGSPTVTLAQPGVQGQFRGHPGTAITITGSGFTAGATINIYTTPDNATQCGPGTTNLQMLTTLNAQTDGSFAVPNGTTWPDNAAKPNTNYYICAISNTNERAISSAYFTVVPDAVASVTTPNINPGDSITIAGSNWLPAQSLIIQIIEVPTSGPTGLLVDGGHVTPDENGSFSKQLTIPADTKPGTYGLLVVADNETSLRYRKDDAITINAPTPTPTAAPSPTPTPTAEPSPTPTPTPTPAATGDNGGSSGGGGPNLMPYVYGLGALGVLLVLIGIIMFATYSAHSS